MSFDDPFIHLLVQDNYVINGAYTLLQKNNSLYIHRQKSEAYIRKVTIQ